MMRSLTRVVALGCALAATQVQAGDLAGRLVTAAESESIGVVHIPNLDALLKKMDQFGKPFSAEISAMFPLFAPNLFQSSRAAQIDRTAPVTFVLLDPKKYTPPFAYVVTTGDPAGYISGLMTPLQGVEQGNEVLVAAAPDISKAALAATPATQGLPTLSGDIQVRLPLASILDRYAADLEKGKNSALEAMKNTPQPPGQQISPEGMTSIMKMYFDLLQGLGGQTEILEFSLALEGNNLLSRTRVQATAGSKMEAFFKAQNSDPSALIGYLPENAPMTFVWGFKSTPELVGAYLAFIDAFLKVDGSQNSIMAELRPQFEAMMTAIGPNYAGFLLPSGKEAAGMQIVQFFDFQKPDEFVKILDDTAAKTVPMVNEFYKKLGMEVEISVGPPSNTKLPKEARQMSFVFKNVPEDQKAIFEKMYGGTEMKFFMLPVQNKILSTFGPGSDELLLEWMTKLASAPQGSAAMPRTTLPGTQVGFATLDLPAYMNMIFSMMPTMPSEALAAMKPWLDTPQEVLFHASVDNGVLYYEVDYPLGTTLSAIKASMDAKNSAAPAPETDGE